MGTSEYRSPRQSTPTPFTFPKKDQAIVIEVYEEFVLNDYVTAVAKIVEPKNIIFASRIANNRVCMYLTSKHLVDMITEHHSKLKIGDKELNLRRLVTPARRIIFSNVCPTIPHSVLESLIRNRGLEPCSQISFLRAGALDSEFSHILSFRRQIYVLPDDSITLPSTIVVKYEETNYRIFLSYDDLTCFACKKTGHIASQCPEKDNQNNIPNDGEMDTSQLSFSQTLTELRSQKRNAPSTSTTTDEDNLTISPDDIPESVVQLVGSDKPKATSTNKSKKIKKSDSTESLTPLDEQLDPIRDIITKKPDSYIMDFDQLVLFLENVQGSPDPLSIAKEFTQDIEELLLMLRNIYPLLTHRSIKNRITRIQNKIKSQMKEIQPTDHQPEKIFDNLLDISQK